MAPTQRTEETPTTRDQVFAFLVAYKREHDGNTPSTREIAEACCLSTSTVHYHLSRLEHEYRIRILDQWPRQIEIVGGTWQYPENRPATKAARETGQDSQDDIGTLDQARDAPPTPR